MLFGGEFRRVLFSSYILRKFNNRSKVTQYKSSSLCVYVGFVREKCTMMQLNKLYHGKLT